MVEKSEWRKVRGREMDENGGKIETDAREHAVWGLSGMRQEGKWIEMKVWHRKWWRAGENHWGSVSAKAFFN